MTEKAKPQFNASIQYLILITDSLRAGIDASIRKDVESYFYICEGLHTLLYARMETQKGRDYMKETRNIMRRNRLTFQKRGDMTSTRWHYQLNDWYDELHFNAHDLGLLMGNKLTMEDKFEQI